MNGSIFNEYHADFGWIGAILTKMLLSNQFKNFIVTAGNLQCIASLKDIGVKEHQIINYKIADVETEALHKNHNREFHYVIDMVGNKMLKLPGVF
ncbi:hypothetical protein [Flavobacterium sp. XS2P39]|uniref:hypothetical protein n=1 Tax=Flavobacterium sp. XS2P39 TaxID=3401725 RepID=UPI003AAD2581